MTHVSGIELFILPVILVSRGCPNHQKQIGFIEQCEKTKYHHHSETCSYQDFGTISSVNMHI